MTPCGTPAAASAQLRLCTPCFRKWARGETATIHLLVENRMLPIPPAILVVHKFDDWLTVMDDTTGKPAAYGKARGGDGARHCDRCVAATVPRVWLAKACGAAAVHVVHVR